MFSFVLATTPLLEVPGLIAAIIICLFLLVFVLLALAFNAGLLFGMSWVREKVNFVKMLRPTVESVNKTSEAAIRGVPPNENESSVAKAVARVPSTMHTVDRKVDEGSDKVADAVIEFRARTVQVQTVLKAFFLPGLLRQKEKEIPAAEQTGLEFKSPGYRMLMEEKAPTEQVVKAGNTVVQDTSAVTASKLKSASTVNEPASKFRDVPTSR